MIILEPYAKALLLAHALASIILAGSSGHLAWEAVHLLRGRPRNVWLALVHARVSFGAFVATYLLGVATYPTYRVRVRFEHFDAEAPWATNLFDMKEMFAAFGLAAAAALFVVSFGLTARGPAAAGEVEGIARRTFASLAVVVAAVVLFNVVSGLLLVSVRSV